VGLTFVIFYRDWKLALIAMVVLPFAYFPIVELGRRTRKVSKGYQEAMAEMTSFLHETFAGNKIVKAFGAEAFEKSRFFKKTRRLFKLEMKTIKYRALTSPIMESLGGVGAALVIWYGGYKVIVGSSTPQKSILRSSGVLPRRTVYSTFWKWRVISRRRKTPSPSRMVTIGWSLKRSLSNIRTIWC